MPYSYPPPAPSLTGDVETISRFLNTPAMVRRAIVDLSKNRFIADTLLQGRVNASGGAVMYEQSETQFATQAVEAIAPGGEYPLSDIATGPALIAAVKKWGLDTIVTDEAIERQNWSPVNRGILKLVNSVVRQVDTVVMTAISSAVTQTTAAAALWSTSTTLVREITGAVAAITALNQGYEPDTVVLSDIAGGYLTANDKVLGLLPREQWNASGGPIFTGYLTRLLNLDVLITPNLPVNTLALVLDRKVLGGLAEEQPLSSKSIRDEERERWRLRAKRVVVPFVQEPNAAYKITGVA